jgi:Putative Flp pilus-assembly TadE/G-like
MLVATRRRRRGQTLVLFALSLPVLLLMAGLVIDGGYAFAQRRVAQNAADMSALAAARVMAQFVSGDTTNGTDTNVKQAIDKTVAANGGAPLAYGPPNGPQYVDMSGNLLGQSSGFGYVGYGAIPTGAVGARVGATETWTPFFVGLVGIHSWSASATATARGGYRVGGPPAGNLLPIAVSQAEYNDAAAKGLLCPAGAPTADCTQIPMTSGRSNVPGQFGWLKFGCGNSVDANGNQYGLGQDSNGCENNTPFLIGQWGDPGANPPVPPQSYGCCTAVGLPQSGDDIGGLPGDKAAVTDTTPGVAYYETNNLIGFVPIFDSALSQGQGGYYHIIGFAGFQLITVKGSKDIVGVLRQVIFPGPVGTVSPGFAGAPLAIELIK